MRFFIAIVSLVSAVILSLSLGATAHKKEDNIKVITLSSKNTASLHSVISSDSAYKVQQKLMDLSSHSNQPLYLVLNSPGGSIDSGNKIIETARGLNNEVNTISIFSASMSFITSQYLDHRYVLESSTLMSHRAAADGIGGQVPGNLITRSLALLASVSEIDEVVARRAGMEVGKYRELIRDELWLTGKQAINLGLADEMVRIKCDSTLNGAEEPETFTVFGFSIKVTWHKCPLISDPISAVIDSKAPNYIKERVDMMFYDNVNYVKKYGAEFRN